MGAPTVTITVAQTAPFRGEDREETRTVRVNVDGGRYFYLPEHVGEVVMTGDGYAEVTAVTDHECHGEDDCEVNEIALPDYTED